ncbi:MAG: YceI family protein [Flavipsychrobacter sp.]
MATTKWQMDPAHSEVQFKVRHMVVSNVTGSFGKFNAEVETEGEDITTAKVHFTADIDSISTNNEQRDTHLKSADFFDGATHPQLKFESTKIEKVSEHDYKMHGNITMRGTSKPITLNVEFGGIINDPWGNVRAGFTVEGKLNRKDFGLNWSAVTEAGHLVVSDEVRLHANAEFVKQA